MADLPYFQFYPSDYLKDTAVLSLIAQGGWMRMLAHMWDSSRRGVLSIRLSALSRLIGTDEATTRSIVDELEDCIVADVQWEGDRVAITSRRMVRDWEKLEGDKNRAIEAGKLGAEKRWGKKPQKHGTTASPPDDPPIAPANGEGNSPPIAPPIASQKSEDRSQKGGERAGAHHSPPPLSPVNLLPVDRVRAELATVFPSAPRHMTAGEQHDLFGSLSVLDELTAEDWQACRGWVTCPDRVRGRKLWPRDRAEFVANAGQAVESIRQWWKTDGRSWWNRSQGNPPRKTIPSISSAAAPAGDVIEDPVEALAFFRSAPTKPAQQSVAVA